MPKYTKNQWFKNIFFILIRSFVSDDDAIYLYTYKYVYDVYTMSTMMKTLLFFLLIILFILVCFFALYTFVFLIKFFII